MGENDEGQAAQAKPVFGERRCANCLGLVRWHLLRTQTMRCEKVGGFRPMTDEEQAIYDEMKAADEMASTPNAEVSAP